ncbi:exonuclease subunit SbcD, partial [bacterium]|nr:exonuclease subunit SbcD [bacterium]
MKNIICSDLHLGNLSDSYIEKNGLERSVNETMKQLDNILKYAIKNKRKSIFIAGDIFENQNPIAKYNELFNSWLKKTCKEKIEIIIIAGNHDQNNSGFSSISPIKKMNFSNVFIFDEDVMRYQAQNINYILVPHLTKNQMNIENVKDYEKESKKIIKERILLNIDKTKKNIIIAHLHAVGATIGTEQKRLRGGINLFPEIKEKEIDMIFSGHLHSYQKLKVGGIDFYYPGSITRNDFAETKEDKGFLIFDDENMDVEFVKLKTTEYKEVKINLVEKGFINLKEEKVKKIVEGKIVKIKIKIDEENKKRINLEEIVSIFSKFCFVAKTELEVIKKDKKTFNIKSFNTLDI